MTRPKVDPDKRQRTAQACDSCKRRKQKCNGLKPCSTCIKRNLDCLYMPTNGEAGSQEPLGSPTKRRHVDDSPRMLKSELESPESSQKLLGTTRPFLGNNDRDFDSRSRISSASGTAADEAELVSLPRMLMDSTGRLLYVGESASLSYLQLIRMIVENVSGHSDFTTDPLRHNILENTTQLPPGTRATGVLPNKKTADILVHSFFTNTPGFIEVLNQKDFLQSVEECYNEPLRISEPLLCILNLVFAIGLVTARPIQGTSEATVIQNLYSEPIDRAELFFRNAKDLYDPVSGFEDADFWSIQALLLMSLYMLIISRRNTSYVYMGMAVRSAFAMGLHREESMVIFSAPEGCLRRNVWRTLFVLDRFLAACLGRPISISEEDCSEHALKPPDSPRVDEPAMSDETQITNSVALDASVRSCYLIGSTLKKVYSKRKVSTLVAQEIAELLEKWEQELHENLHCARLMNGSIDPAQAVAILHVNLLHCHSVLLLTRPFFLYLLKMGCHEISRSSQKPPHVSQRLEKFSQACVEASERTIILARLALDSDYLSQCNPFIIHFVFSAALIIMSNEFASLYHNPDAEQSIQSALLILGYCGKKDAQAKRVSYIIETFHEANMQRPSTAKKVYLPGRKIPTLLAASQVFHQPGPLSPFFRHVKPERQDIYMSDMSPKKDRNVMNLSTAPSEPSVRPMMHSALQQPSPEGSVSLSSNIVATSMAPGMETMSSSDPEFDFDSLWQGWSTVPTTTSSMGIPHPMHPVEAYGSYGLQQPTIPQGDGLHPHLPPYPPSDYR